MCRRFLTLLLLFSLLLTQWVNAHRRNDGCAACGRPPAPHAHLRELVPFRDTAKCCRCEVRPSENDRDCCNSRVSDGEPLETKIGTQSDPRDDCSADVILLSSDSEFTAAKIESKCDSPASAIDTALLPRSWHSEDNRNTVVSTTRQPSCWSSAHLYLLNRALLI